MVLPIAESFLEKKFGPPPINEVLGIGNKDLP
jgi:hypothetical protein